MTLRDFKMKWEPVPNNDVQVLHVNCRLWNSIHYDVYDIELNDAQNNLVNSILEIDGVQDVVFELYSLRVYKGRMFDWYELTGPIEDAVKDYVSRSHTDD